MLRPVLFLALGFAAGVGLSVLTREQSEKSASAVTECQDELADVRAKLRSTRDELESCKSKSDWCDD